MPPPQNPWRSRTRRLLYFFGASTTLYLLFSYAMDRMREARLRAMKERKERDLLKQHFTSLVSTISYTLYALLPTLEPQLSDEYPVEQISQALQGLSVASSNTDSVNPTPDNSVVLPQPASEEGILGPSPEASYTGSMEMEHSWSSEYKTESVAESERPSLVGDSTVHGGDDDAASSTLSQTISLPTDVSSLSPSPVSVQSQLHPSPPQPPQQEESPSPFAGKSKKELWRELKVQTLTRSLTTAYLIPLLYLLATSQLATLARERYLSDVDESLPSLDPPRDSAPVNHTKKRGLFGYFSTDAMGLGDFVERNTPNFLNPAKYLPSSVSQYLPFSASSQGEDETAALASAAQKEDIEMEKAEDERVFLTYSWWILHVGWRAVGKRVENAVEEVFGRMALKKELTLEDWKKVIREVRARVETQQSPSGPGLYSFLPHMMPSYPLPPFSRNESCPIPSTPPINRPHLTALLEQSRSHLTSADATYLIEKGVSTMTQKLVDSLREDLYAGSEIGPILGQPSVDVNTSRRLVDCLPAVDRWGKNVWEAIPDAGIENLTSIPEFEAFAALIFGDWAPR